MRKSSIIGLASALAPGRKYKFILTGLQFAYLGYRMLKKRKAQKAEPAQ